MPRRILNRSFWVKYRGEIGYIIGMVGVTIALIGQHQNTDAIKEQSQLGAQTHTAVCALKADLKHRVVASALFLATHPSGAFGVTPKVIRASLENERRTISALASLRCP